ncbi:MAG: hypothetical protein ACSHYA_12170 [Opitutaceae bacterium]
MYDGVVQISKNTDTKIGVLRSDSTKLSILIENYDDKCRVNILLYNQDLTEIKESVSFTADRGDLKDTSFALESSEGKKTLIDTDGDGVWEKKDALCVPEKNE